MRRAALIVILLLLVPNIHQSRATRKTAAAAASLKGSEIHCAISLGKGLQNNLRFGYNYELLQEFGRTHSCNVFVHEISDSLSLCDSLLDGVYDLAVLKAEDSLKVKGICKINSHDGKYIWALREEHYSPRIEYDRWLSYARKEDEDLMLMAKIFENPFNPFKRAEGGIKSKYISPYDNLFRKYAKEIGWDWKMLAALSYAESKFTINNISSKGAVGLMQVMPLEKYGSAESLLDPETNIKAGVELIYTIQQKYISSPDIDPFEREKLVLASYNAGSGRIAECRRIAAEHGLNPDDWEDVKTAFRHHPEFNGSTTEKYVEYVLSIYEAFGTICPYK